MVVYVTQDKDIPKGPHWAILKFSGITIPGDERSRTHPGHGYGEEYRHIVEYQAYTDEEEWRTEIRRLADPKNHSPKPYYAMHVKPAEVQINITVAVDTK